MFVLGARNVGNTWFRSIDINSVVGFFPVKSDFEIGVIASKGRDLGAVERQDVVNDGFNRFLGEISIVDS